MRKVLLGALAIAIGASAWWVWHNHHVIKDGLQEYVENGEFLTLEARYTPEELMAAHRKELLPSTQYAFLEPIVKYAPYLLIDSKYNMADKGTKEGVLLWGLVDGELVLDTESWERTHGYEDAINVGADRNDFRILFALSKNGGALTRDQLQNELHLERDTLDPWIDSAIKKHLIVPVGSELRIHLQDPKIWVVPQTKMAKSFVRKPYSNSQRLSRKYSKSQIESIAKAAFGSAFSIRSISEVFLPVYCLCVKNPDGSTHTSYWNALTGKQITNLSL